MLLQPEKGRLVVDRDELICMDRKYKERQMLLVMHFKLVGIILITLITVD